MLLNFVGYVEYYVFYEKNNNCLLYTSDAADE